MRLTLNAGIIVLTVILLSLLSLAVSCGGDNEETSAAMVQPTNDISFTPVSNNATTLTQPRTQLTVEQLLQPDTPPLLDLSYLAKPEWGQKASDSFSGSLTFNETQMTTSIGGEYTLFPSFSVDFVSDGDVLIPRQKGIISTWQKKESFWDVIIGTGKIWKEPGDKEWNRASFPLTLVSDGQAKNCVCTFVYNQKEISNIYMQCSQETSPKRYQIGDMQVTLPTEYQPKTFEDSKKIIQQYYKIVADRLPVYPLDEADSEGKVALLFDDDNASTSLGALIIDGNVYLHPPKTRHGTYPYPNEMRNGVMSVTKSLAGGLSLFYLAERYGEEIFDERITDYVPGLADHPAWQGVTFSHALNMVTGTERGEWWVIGPFLETDTADKGIELISYFGDSPEAPGKKFKYDTTNTFVLSYAMQKYVERKEGEGIYYWDLVRENVLKPINAEHLALQHTVENDGSKGIPILGWGAFPTIDEAAKIALLFSNEGKYEDQQLLHQGKVREALNRTDGSGYETTEILTDFADNYCNSFWLAADVPTEKCTVNIPFMLGGGGNYVAFFPSNVILIRFMDEYDYDMRPYIQAVEEIRTSCK